MKTLKDYQLAGTSRRALLTPDLWLCGVQYGIECRLKPVIANLEEVEEGQRGLYVQEMKDGKPTGSYVLDIEGIDNPLGLKRAHDADKEALRQAREQLNRLKDIDPAKYQELQREAQARDQQEAALRREYEDKIRDIEEAHRQQIARKDGEIKRVRDMRDQMFLDNALMPAIAAEKGTPEFLLPHMRGRLKVVEKDGALQLEVRNAEGGPMLGEGGKPATPADLVKEFKEHTVFARAFEGSNAGGSGSDQGGSGGGGRKKIDENTPNPFSKAQWNKSKQTALINRDAKGRILNDDAKEQAEALARKAGFDSLDKAMAATRAIQ